MTAVPSPIDAPAPTAPAAPRMPVRRERLLGLAVLGIGIVFDTAASQLHHHLAPTEAGGWRELPTYAIAGALGWLVAFGIAFIAPHRAAAPAAVSRRVGMGLAVAAVPAAALLWWSPIPLCLGAAAVLLVRRARRLGTTSRWDAATTVVAVLTLLAPVAVFAVRLATAAGR